MYNVYFDSGTTNSRAYLLYKNEVSDMITCAVGSKDSSIAGSNLILLKGLKRLFDEMISKNGLNEKEILNVYASGMVTSPFGIKEISHVSTPVSIKKLHDSIFAHYEPLVFKRQIKLIRGVKTVSANYIADFTSVSEVNNMRGEEIEVFGIIPNLPIDWQHDKFAIILPGSHTHIAFINQNELVDIWSTFSGELYYSITTGTILSNSVSGSDALTDPETIFLGYENLKKYGFNRALYICHAMKIFEVGSNALRRSYLEGVIAGGVVSGFEKAGLLKWGELKRFVIAGRSGLTDAYKILLKKTMPECMILTLAAEERRSFAVQGFINLLSEA